MTTVKNGVNPLTPEQRVKRILRKVCSVELNMESLKSSIKSLQAEYEGLAAKAEDGRATALELMERQGLNKIFSVFFLAELTRAADGLDVVNADAVPPRFAKMERVILKADLLKYWRGTGEVPAGCELRPGKRSLKLTKKNPYEE